MPLELDWRNCEGELGEAFGFYMMFTGIGWEITDKNAEEFYCRIKLHETVAGPVYYVDGAPLDVTPALVLQHVGLKANVAPESWAKFAKRMLDVEKGDAKRQWRSHLNELERSHAEKSL